MPTPYRRRPITKAWVDALPKPQPEAVLSDAAIEGVLLNHLYRPAYHSCLCGQRDPSRLAGGHYAWWAAHVRTALRSQGMVSR